jgi:hypothetical protein
MRHHFKFTPIKTKDIHAIMKAIRTCGTLSGIAYCRLHNYIVTLERLLGEGVYPPDKAIALPEEEECLFLNN